MADYKVTVNTQNPIVKLTQPAAGSVSKVNITDLTSTVTGHQGSTGWTGSTGLGATGFTGSTGWSGSTGFIGATGFTGASGFIEIGRAHV